MNPIVEHPYSPRDYIHPEPICSRMISSLYEAMITVRSQEGASLRGRAYLILGHTCLFGTALLSVGETLISFVVLELSQLLGKMVVFLLLKPFSLESVERMIEKFLQIANAYFFHSIITALLIPPSIPMNHVLHTRAKYVIFISSALLAARGLAEMENLPQEKRQKIIDRVRSMYTFLTNEASTIRQEVIRAISLDYPEEFAEMNRLQQAGHPIDTSSFALETVTVLADLESDIRPLEQNMLQFSLVSTTDADYQNHLKALAKQSLEELCQSEGDFGKGIRQQVRDQDYQLIIPLCNYIQFKELTQAKTICPQNFNLPSFARYANRLKKLQQAKNKLPSNLEARQKQIQALLSGSCGQLSEEGKALFREITELASPLHQGPFLKSMGISLFQEIFTSIGEKLPENE